jgi:tRNA modification GTPase
MTQDKSQKRNEDKTMLFSTIAAIATPAGRGGIGIVRISGPQSFPIGLYLFKPHRKYNESTLCIRFPYKTHRFYFGHFHDYHQNTPIDEVLIVFMKAPRTYTREDVVEIHGHGGYQTLTSILKAVLDAGAILAEPGEFTKRAYLNGRIDLTQAEAVINLINARSNLSREVAFSQITGNLRKRILDIRKLLIDMMTRIQAEIDFPDEIPVSINRNMLFSEIHNHVVMPIQNLIKNHDQYYFLNEGIQTVIIGAPNVGKSSLMNCLSRKEKSIVTSYPGTTRDLIEEHVQFIGFPMVLTDTAGLHDSKDPVEILGIDKALAKIQRADLILFVLQAGHPLTENELRISKLIMNKHVILVFNKIDLLAEYREIDLPETLAGFKSVFISTLLNTGMDSLKTIIENVISQKMEGFHDSLLPNIRHKNLLEKSMASLLRLSEGLLSGIPTDLLILDLNDAIIHLGQIFGEDTPPDILDQIFKDFCIGK